MKKKSLLIVAIVLAISILAPIFALNAYEALRGPTELLYYDKAKAYKGYTLFGASRSVYTYLIDMEGNIINTWPNTSNPQMLENGNVLGRSSKDAFMGFKEFDWKGNVVWEYYEKRENYHPHHDHQRIFNPKLKEYTTIYIANRDLNHEEVIAAGANPSWSKSYDGSQMDAIVEVDMNGKVVWEWWFFDHLVQDLDQTKKNYVGKGTIASYPGKLNINFGMTVRQDWLHCNSLDFNRELDHIVINSVHGEFYVIDHGATFVPGDPEKSKELAASDAGDFLYRWGDPAKYAQGEKPYIERDWERPNTGTRQMGACHDIQWIREGSPGAGHFLVFDNADQVYQSSQQSGAIEINPYLDLNGNDTGNYINPPDAGYHMTNPDFRTTHHFPRQLSNQIVWSWHNPTTSGFFSNHGSGCQRLPNGNTLLCGSSEGHFVEVTPEGECVWEYISPVTGKGVKKHITTDVFDQNGAFRAYRFGLDYPGFAGKDLKPLGKITKVHADLPPLSR